MSSMSKREMEAEISRLAPFRHNLELPYGLRTGSEDPDLQDFKSARVQGLVDHAFPALLEACGGSLKGLRVLDLACNSGGFSIEASRLGADHVLGIDIVDRYLEQARFVKAALGVENVDLKKLDVHDLSEESVGKFDVTFCFGLLYHLENPVLAMRRIGSVTGRTMLVDTNTIVTNDRKTPMWRMSFPSPKTSPDQKGASTNLWRDREYCQFKPNATAVRRLLKFLGFKKVRLIAPDSENLPKQYLEGRRSTFLAVRD